MKLTKEEYPNLPLGWYLGAKSKRLVLNTNNGFLFYDLYLRWGLLDRTLFGFDADPTIRTKITDKEINTDFLYDYYYLGDNEEFYNLIVDLGEWLPGPSNKGELITDDHGDHYIVSRTYTIDDIKYGVCNKWRCCYEEDRNKYCRSEFVEKIFDALEKAGKGLPDGVIAYETYCLKTHYREIKTNAYLIGYYDIYDYAKKKHQKAKRQRKKQLALAS